MNKSSVESDYISSIVSFRKSLAIDCGINNDAEMYKIIREYIQHEDNLVNQRKGWFISLNSFLFLALGAILSGVVGFYRDTIDPKNIRAIDEEIIAVIMAFSVIGIVSAIATRISVGAAYRAIEALEDHWRFSWERTIYGERKDMYLPHTQRESDIYIDSPKAKLWKINFPFFGTYLPPVRSYDPAVVFPYITGGGPSRRPTLDGKVEAFGLIYVISLFWFMVLCFSIHNVLVLVSKASALPGLYI